MPPVEEDEKLPSPESSRPYPQSHKNVVYADESRKKSSWSISAVSQARKLRLGDGG